MVPRVVGVAEISCCSLGRCGTAEKALRRAARSESALCDDNASQSSTVTGMVSLSEWGLGDGSPSDSDLTPLDAAVEVLYEKQ